MRPVDREELILHLVFEAQNRWGVGCDEGGVYSSTTISQVVCLNLGLVVCRGQETNPVGAIRRRPPGPRWVAIRVCRGWLRGLRIKPSLGIRVATGDSF